MSEWTELKAHGERVRYRKRGEGRMGYRVQYWHPSRHEWRDVVSVSNRDWFAIGFEAGKKADPQTKLAL